MSKQAYAKLAKHIRTMNQEKQALYVGEMLSDDSVRINDLILEKDDFLVAEHLTKKQCTEIDISINASGGTAHSHTYQDNTKYLKPLKSGDVVFVIRAETPDDEDGIYIIVERLVNL